MVCEVLRMVNSAENGRKMQFAGFVFAVKESRCYPNQLPSVMIKKNHVLLSKFMMNLHVQDFDLLCSSI